MTPLPLSDRVMRQIIGLMETGDVSQRELTKRLGVTEARVSQILGRGSNLTLKTVDRILEALTNSGAPEPGDGGQSFDYAGFLEHQGIPFRQGDAPMPKGCICSPMDYAALGHMTNCPRFAHAAPAPSDEAGEFPDLTDDQWEQAKANAPKPNGPLTEITSFEAGVPAGMVLVPTEPTDEMLNAAQERLCELTNVTHFNDEHQAGMYKSMLAAAPKQATPTDEAASQGWQPIETAPKDGTPVLLFARCKTARASIRVVGWYLSDGGWIECAFSPNSPRGLVPTHWMPLPESPAPGSAGETLDV